MKKIILLTSTALMLSTSAFAAANLQDFVGSYKPGVKCELGEHTVRVSLITNGEREVVGVVGVTKASIVDEQDAAFEFRFDSNKTWLKPRRNLAKQVGKTFWQGQTLVNTVTNVYNDGSREVIRRLTLDKTEKGLIYRTFNSKKVLYMCSLTKI